VLPEVRDMQEALIRALFGAAVLVQAIAVVQTSVLRRTMRRDRVLWSALLLAVGTILVLGVLTFVDHWVVPVHGVYSLGVAAAMLGVAVATVVGLVVWARRARRDDAEQDEVELLHARHEALFRGNDIPIMLVDPESGLIIDANPAAGAFLELSCDALRAMTVRELAAVECDPRGIEVARPGRGDVMHLHYRRPSGALRELDIHISPITVNGRTFTYGTMEDVTERDTAERELREHKRLLENRVAERTAELSATVAKLEEASAARERFMASMSHELRTPLNSIIGYTRVLLSGMAGETSEEQRRQLAMVDTSATRLWSMLGEMLEVIELDGGGVQLDVGEFTASDAILEAAKKALPAALAKGLDIHTVLPDVDIDLETDRGKVVEVLGHLLDNAVKFTPEGEVTLSVDPGTNAHVAFSVIDTGIGIRRDALGSIQETFAQIDSEDGMKPSGAGLGLPLSTRLAAMMRGAIEVESTEGAGSTFRLVIPRRLVPVAPRS
jgi:PAS domain S-box-containing protein